MKQVFYWLLTPGSCLSVHEHSRAQTFGDFEGGQEAEELLVVAAAGADALALVFGEVLAQDEVEEVVVVGCGRERQFARVSCARGVLGGEAGERVEEVVGRQVGALSRELDGQAQLEEAQAARGRHGAQRLRALAVERRVRGEQYAHKPRPVR